MTDQTAIEQAPARPITTGDRPVTAGAWTYRPAADVFNSPDEYRIVMDLPGTDPSSIDVSVDSGVLTVTAGAAPRIPDRARILRTEYGVGAFHRRFSLDDGVDASAISAEYRDGSLVVRMPKLRHARPHKVQVSA